MLVTRAECVRAPRGPLPRAASDEVAEGPLPLVRLVAAAVAGGVDVVQVREREASVTAMRRLLPRLREAIGETAKLLLNHPDAFELASLVDGVHLPERAGSVAEARALLGEGGRVGRSVHSVAAAVAAAGEGADYLIAGSIFPTASHPDAAPAGLEWLSEVAASVPIPVLAIGGVTPENAADCLRAGAQGVAVLSGLMDAADPQAAALAYRRAMGESGGQV